MTPRRPSTAPNAAGPGRMPFAAAEALLWWPELRKQHTWLLTEMRTLQTQHEAYNTRIQATEAVSEAAEAAVSRIRHVEMQVQAMEAVDKDKVFAEWVAAEITQLKILVERNGRVRQRLVEMESEVEKVKEGVEGSGDVASEMRRLVRRVEGLEKERERDGRKIEVLEQVICELRAGRKEVGEEKKSSTAEHNHGQTSHGPKMPHIILHDISDSGDTTETEDEGPARPYEPAGQQIQAAGSSVNELMVPKKAPVGLLTQAPPVMSARQRLFKRPSIHNSKLPKSTAAAVEPHARQVVDLPTMQLTNRPNQRKRKAPEPDLYPERITRSQFKHQEQSTGQPHKSGPGIKVATEPTATKRKRPNAAGEPNKLLKTTQLVAPNPAKQRRLNAAPPSGTAQVHDENGNGDRPLQYAQHVLKSPRKGGSKPIACIPCRQRHVACDRARPVCGECTKRSVTCHYRDAPSKDTGVFKAQISSPQKKSMPKIAMAGPSRPGAKINTEQEPTSHSSSTIQIKASGSANPLAPGAHLASTTTLKKRTMPDITDYETYLKLRAEDKIP